MNQTLTEMMLLAFTMSLLSIPYLSLRAKSNTKQAWAALLEKTFSGNNSSLKQLTIGSTIRLVELSVLFKNLYLGVIAYMFISVFFVVKKAIDVGEPLVTDEVIGLSLGVLLSFLLYVTEKRGDIKRRRHLRDIERQLGVDKGLTIQELLNMDAKLISKVDMPMFKR